MESKVEYLCGKIAELTQKPIRQVAQEVLNEGYISQRGYDVLRYRVPFDGDKRESLDDVGNKFSNLRKERTGVTKEMIRKIEEESLTQIIKYLHLQQIQNSGVLDLKISEIPWTYDRNSTRARNALLRKIGDEATVRDVWDYFNSFAQIGRPVVIGKYGKSSHKAAYEDFRKIGVALPNVDVL